MNAAEGLRRLRTIAYRVMQIGSGAGLLVWISAGVIRGGHLGLAELALVVLVPLLLGGLLLLVEWVLEGFLLGRDADAA